MDPKDFKAPGINFSNIWALTTSRQGTWEKLPKYMDRMCI
jgi:hypothetical protein